MTNEDKSFEPSDLRIPMHFVRKQPIANFCKIFTSKSVFEPSYPNIQNQNSISSTSVNILHWLSNFDDISVN